MTITFVRILYICRWEEGVVAIQNAIYQLYMVLWVVFCGDL